MNWSQMLESAVAFIAFMVAAGAGFGSLWYAFRSKELKLLKEKVNECESRHIDNEKRITDTEGKLNTVLTIPLQEIADHMKKTNEILAKIQETK